MRLLYYAVMTCALAACRGDDVTANSNVETRRALIFTLGGTVFDLVLGRDTVIVPSQPRIERVVENIVRDSRDSAAFVLAYDSFANRVARPLDLRTGRIASGTQLTSIEASAGPVGANLGFGLFTALSPAGDRMAFVRSTRNGSFGITAVRAAFGTVDWFAPEFDLGGGVFGRWKNADVLFVAGRRAGAAAETLVWAVDPSSGAVLDSVVIGVRSIAAQGGVLGLVYAGPAGRVLVQRFGSVTSCPANLGSAASCTTVATVPESGRLSYQEGDSVVLLHDPGRRDGPGSGSVYAISLDATRVDSHPLPRVAGDAFVSQGVSALRGGTVWVVTGGTIPFFALFREQSPVVLLYDPLSRRVLKRIAVPSNEPVTITVPL